MTTTDLGWFELMIQKWKTLYPINSLPNCQSPLLWFICNPSGRTQCKSRSGVNPEKLQSHPYNLSHRAKQWLPGFTQQWGNTNFHGLLFTQMYIRGQWWKATGETWRGTWTPTLQKPSAAPELQGVNARQLPSISALVSAQPCFVLCWLQLAKGGVCLAMAGLQALVCTVGTGPSGYTPSPATGNPSPCGSLWASRTLQLAQGHHNRTVPRCVSTQLPTLPPTQLLVEEVKLWYHSDNFMLLC